MHEVILVQKMTDREREASNFVTAKRETALGGAVA